MRWQTRIRELLQQLTAGEQEVLRVRFGVGVRAGASDGVADPPQIPLARLRQVEKQALRKLRATALVDPPGCIGAESRRSVRPLAGGTVRRH